MADMCIVCNLHLRQRQEVLCCISCHGKQHRTCNSGISCEEYQRMRSQGQVVFQCVECVEPTVPYYEVTTTSELPSRLLPDAESTRIVEESINIPIVPHAEPHHPEEESLNDQTSPQELHPRKRKKDYKQVFARILELMPSPPVTELLVADFEEGMWRAAKSVLRGVRIHGCAFHWGQAVWRHVQELGLQIDYSQRDGVFKFVRKLLALPFLPEEQIPVAFHALKETVTSERLIQLTNYIERTWINGDIWTPSSWTVYRMAVRTNNDVEGWHHRINRRAQKSSLPFYVLVILLYKETASIPTQLKIISEGKLRRYQRKTTRLLQCHINQLWDNYNDGSISASRLLKKCGQIYNGQ